MRARVCGGVCFLNVRTVKHDDKSFLRSNLCFEETNYIIKM